MSGCRLSWSIREARIVFRMTDWYVGGGGGCGESVMCPRSALCGCCENTLPWDGETVLYGCWSKVGRSRLSSFFAGMPSGVVWWNW